MFLHGVCIILLTVLVRLANAAIERLDAERRTAALQLLTGLDELLS